MADSVRTFCHHFRGGVSCEVRIDLAKLRARQLGYLRFEWSRTPGRRVIPEYRRWILSVWQRVADETGLKTMEVLQVSAHQWEIWAFEPGQTPRKIDEIMALLEGATHGEPATSAPPEDERDR